MGMKSIRGMIWSVIAAATCAVSGCAQVPSRPVSHDGASAALSIVRLEHVPTSPAELALPLVLWAETTTEAEPMAAWFLRVDLLNPLVEVVTITPPDPDGEGPAEAVLTDPIELARAAGVQAAVNANGFSRLPGPDGKIPEGRWRPGESVDIAGLAVSTGSVRSLPGAQQGSLLAFWTDRSGGAHIGSFTGRVDSVQEGCNAWWIDLVKEGRVLPQPGGDRHPRTALGLDAGGRWLLLAVVDGRQPRHSVGMTAEELAALMVRHGCQRAVNLDGGGSSVLVATGTNGVMQAMNRPSDGKPRPLPVMLGVRRKGSDL